MRWFAWLSLIAAACAAPDGAGDAPAEPVAPTDAAVDTDDTDDTDDDAAPTDAAVDTDDDDAPTDADDAPTDAEPTDVPDPVDSAAPAGCAGDIGSAVGECAADFTLFDADGAAWTLSQHRGSPLLVDFSAMWCPTCQRFARESEALVQAYDGRLAMATVLFQDAASDDPDAADLVAWRDSFGVTTAILADPGELTRDLYAARSTPTVLLLDADGRITWRAGGNGARTGVNAAVEAVLGPP